MFLRFDSDPIVQRFDLARLGPNVKKTPQGFLRVPANFTRAGVFDYRTANGVRKELRPESEVFAPASLETLAGAPVTRDHPHDNGVAVMITPENAGKYVIGHGGDAVERKDALVTGYLTLTEGKAIRDAEAKALRDISMGYSCALEATPGVDPKYGRYDCIQRNIVYNHIAVGPSLWGRAGADCAMRLDKADARYDSALSDLVAQRLDLLGAKSLDWLAQQVGMDLYSLQGVIFGWDPLTSAFAGKLAGVLRLTSQDLLDLVPRTDRREPVEEIVITIGGVEFKVPKAAGQAFIAEQKRLDSQVSAAVKEKEALQGRFDAAGEELEEVKAKLAEAVDPKRFDSAVERRAALLSSAREVLGEDFKGEGKSDRAIMEEVIKHDKADLDLSKKADEYVQARFDSLMETRQDSSEEEPAPKGEGGDLLTTRKAAHAAAGGALKKDRQRFDSGASRDKMVNEGREGWQKPLAFSRDA